MVVKRFSQRTVNGSFSRRNTGSLNTEQVEADNWAGRAQIMGKHLAWSLAHHHTPSLVANQHAEGEQKSSFVTASPRRLKEAVRCYIGQHTEAGLK